MKTEYQISGMRENGGLHEMVTEVVVMLTLKSATADSRPTKVLSMVIILQEMKSTKV